MNTQTEHSKQLPETKWITVLIASVIMALLFVVGGQWMAVGISLFVLILIAALEWPMAAFYVVIGIELIVPVYVVIPPIGFLPNVPVSLTPLILLLGICILEAILGPKPAELGFYGKLFMFAISLFAVITLLSLTDEQTTRETVMTWIRSIVIPLSIFWVALRKLQTIEDIQKLTHIFIFAGIVCTLYAIVEYSLGKNILIEKLIMTSDDSMRETMSHIYLTSDQLSQFGALIYRCFSVFITPIEFGSFMSMVFPFPVIAAVNNSGKMRWFNGVLALICFLGIVLSFSRGPLLTAILQIIGLTFFLKPLRRMVIAGTIISTLAIALAWPVIGEYVISRVKSEDNVTLRFKLWEIGLHIFEENPILGVGLGNFVKYQNQAERTYRVGPIYESGGDIEHVGTVDNTYIQLASETGILGFGTFMGAMGILFILVAKLYRLSSQENNVPLLAIVLGIGFSGFGYLFNAITYTAYSFFVVTPTLFLLYAAALVLERTYKSE